MTIFSYRLRSSRVFRSLDAEDKVKKCNAYSFQVFLRVQQAGTRNESYVFVLKVSLPAILVPFNDLFFFFSIVRKQTYITMELCPRKILLCAHRNR